jgi:hypothetical protein
MVFESDVVLVVEHNLNLSFADLARFPRHSLRATDELGKESLFEEVLVTEILKSAGVKFAKDLRGKRLADYCGRDRRRQSQCDLLPDLWRLQNCDIEKNLGCRECIRV